MEMKLYVNSTTVLKEVKYSETQATGLWVEKKGNEVNIDQLRDIILS